MIKNLIRSEKSSSLIKKLLYISIFFTLSPIALATSLITLITLSNQNAKSEKVLAATTYQPSDSGVQIFASLPSDFPSVYGEVVSEDARSELVRQFLERNNSPMLNYANHIVQASDIYSIDYRLITAIAMKESGLGKAMPTSDCNNAWGWGIHSEGTLCFDSWEEGIESVTKGIKESYIDEGLVTPDEIMTKWVPHSPEGAWAEGVNYYMEKML